MKMDFKGCVFCREVVGSKDTNFSKIYPELPHRRLIETENFIVMPCIGQLTEKHCLLISKDHFTNICTAATNKINELTDLLKEFKERCSSPQEDLLVFEHGANNASQGGCGIYHAHLHLVPVHRDFEIERLYRFEKGNNFCSLNETLGEPVGMGAYVLAGMYNRGFAFSTIKTALPSQYLRANLAGALGMTKWDWHEFGRQDSFIAILKEYGSIRL